MQVLNHNNNNHIIIININIIIDTIIIDTIIIITAYSYLYNGVSCATANLTTIYISPLNTCIALSSSSSSRYTCNGNQVSVTNYNNDNSCQTASYTNDYPSTCQVPGGGSGQSFRYSCTSSTTNTPTKAPSCSPSKAPLFKPTYAPINYAPFYFPTQPVAPVVTLAPTLAPTPAPTLASTVLSVQQVIDGCS